MNHTQNQNLPNLEKNSEFGTIEAETNEFSFKYARNYNDQQLGLNPSSQAPNFGLKDPGYYNFEHDVKRIFTVNDTSEGNI